MYYTVVFLSRNTFNWTKIKIFECFEILSVVKGM